jgi:hypothetical protein
VIRHKSVVSAVFLMPNFVRGQLIRGRCTAKHLASDTPSQQWDLSYSVENHIRPNLPANQIRGLKIQSPVNAAVFSPMIERRASVLTKVFN